MPAEFANGKDMTGNNADGVSTFRGDAALINELRYDGFGKDVQKIEQKGRSLGVRLLWSRGKEHTDVHSWFGDLGRFSKDGHEL